MALIAALLVACGKTPMPPPISDGKCLVDEYDGGRAERQTCVYGGYEWKCHWSDAFEHHECSRGPEVVGERRP